MKFYLIAGEASGDLHASNLVKEMKRKLPSAVFRGIGGNLMQEAGVELTRHYRETAFMGFWEVVTHLRRILGFIDQCKEDIKMWQPDAVILVDYPGFNLRIAAFAGSGGFKVFYYISPQVWAWKPSRIRKIKRYVTRLFVIFPFEKAFYARWNYDVEFVGHPLLDAMQHFKPEPLGLKDQRPIIALLPGSRRQEIESMLPAMVQVSGDFPEFQFVAAGVHTVDQTLYESLAGGKITVVYGKTYSLVHAARAALVTSGTATLETALLGIPQVVCYRGSAVSYFIARRLVAIKYIAIVNLILDRRLVKELIQNDLNRANLMHELQPLLQDGPQRQRLLEGYQELRKQLGGPGASAHTADAILALMQVAG